jgi:hypothetical protein
MGGAGCLKGLLVVVRRTSWGKRILTLAWLLGIQAVDAGLGLNPSPSSYKAVTWAGSFTKLVSSFM